VSLGGQETVKKTDIGKVCVNTWSYAAGEVISNSPKSAEMEFASFDDLISKIKLAFQVPSGKVNFRGRTRILLDPSMGIKECVQLTASEIWRVSAYRFR